MAAVEFNAVIKILGINPYVLVSKQRAAKLHPNWRKPMPVYVQINGKPDTPWRINMVPVGNGDFYLYLHETVRKASATKVGDKVTVAIDLDRDYRSGPQPLPDWFSRPLSSDLSAMRNWAKLSPSRQKEIVRYLLNLKSDAARQRNVEKVLTALSGETIRFLGRTWRDGS